MRLVLGPVGSGKTTLILDELRDALRRHDTGVRLLTPTATMAEHLRHALAREGFVVRPHLVTTLSGFVADWVEGLRQVSNAGLHLLTGEALAAAAPAEFAPVAGLPGLQSSLERTLEELATAGCSADRLAQTAEGWTYGRAVTGVYREVERRLAAERLGFRSDLLRLAARRIAREGTGAVHTIWLDGFFTLSPPEIALVRELARFARVTLTLPAGHEEIDASSVVRLERKRIEPAVEAFSAENPGRECEILALRVWEQVQSGRPFREIGVILRNPAVYLSPLETALGRLGIPARSYFPRSLAASPVLAFIHHFIEALCAGWDHGRLLEAWRAAGWREPLDRLDFMLRKRIPSRGLEALRAADGLPPDLSGQLERAPEFERWAQERLPASSWTSRISELARFARDAPSAERESLHQALDEAASLMSTGAMRLDEFWRAVRPSIEQVPIRALDRRRNVLHLLSVYEARQWELPVVLVCGLTEKEFPRRPRQDPFFPEAARRALRASGIRLRTSEEWEREEEFLFEVARSRATHSLVLSFPESDVSGAGTLPSRFLEGIPAVPDRRTARIRPRLEAAAPSPLLRSAEAVSAFRAATTVFSPSGLERYLDCPFLYFAERGLRLESRPPRPDERLDPLLRGTIVHEVLSRFARGKGDLDPVFEQVHREVCEKNFVPGGYRAEFYRRQMLDDLRAFLADPRLPDAARTVTELPFEFTLAEGLRVRGRIDRIDVGESGAVVVDYKYSRRANVLKRVNGAQSLQGPLYVLAAQTVTDQPVTAMLFAGLRLEKKHDEPVLEGWTAAGFEPAREPLTREWLEAGRALAIETANRIWSGRFAPEPADRKRCKWCDYRDVCRYEGVAAVAAEAE